MGARTWVDEAGCPCAEDTDGWAVRLEPWHSDVLGEDFTGVTLWRPDGWEAMHCGMAAPEVASQEPAEVLASWRALHDDLRAAGERLGDNL